MHSVKYKYHQLEANSKSEVGTGKRKGVSRAIQVFLNFSFSSTLNEDIYGAAAESQRAAAAVFPAKGSWRCHGVIANMLIQNEQTGTHHRHLKEAFTSEWTAWSTL